MPLCDCPFGPRCESNRCCEDPNQSIGIKDHRTGAVRARADWIWIREPSRGFIRSMFLCNDCWEEIKESVSRPLVGIDQPEHANEYWRPSIGDHIRLTMIELNREKRMHERPANIINRDQPLTRREQQLSPAQWAQVQNIRRSMRQGR